MLKIVIDTNILISAAISPSGKTAQVVNLILTDESFDLCLSKAVLNEYEVVLTYEKFTKIHHFASQSVKLLGAFKLFGEIFNPTQIVDILTDKSDNKLLELAEVAEADFLITGNTKHFNLDFFGKTRIVTPTEFWELFKTE